MIQLKSYNLNNLILSNEILNTYINNFWSEIFKNIKDNKHLLLMTKVYFSDETVGYRTLGHLRKVNFNDRELFIDYLSQRLTILNDSYVTLPISDITFSYIVRDGICTDDDRALLHNLNNKDLSFHNFNNLKLPISMNPSEYGEIRSNSYVQINGESIQRFIVKNGNRWYEIDVNSNTNVNKVSITGNMSLNWTDTLINDSIIMRDIKKSTIYFMDGEIVLRKQILSAKAFKVLRQENKLITDFFTIDIETIRDNLGKLIPYLICAYNGKNYITSYTQDQTLLFKNFFNQLLTHIKSGTTTLIYAHNLSGFDGIFLLKQILNLGKVEPLIFQGKLISIKLVILGNTKSENKTIIFKDSYLLLPHSLRKLCEAFNITIPKGFFPFKLTNIFYNGILPKFEYWTGISLSEYELLVKEYLGITWNFKDQAIKYCKLDCSSLHEILIQFNQLIFNHFKINIHKTLTLPQLAMKIYKTHFMPKDTIYQILGKPEYFIRESYTGGAVDVYIPHNRVTTTIIGNIKSKFIKLFAYDVNSLYPSVMANNPMPIGRPIAFIGDIRQIEPNAYGFFYCKITSPTYLEHPLIQRRIKTSDGMRTIAGLGQWTGGLGLKLFFISEFLIDIAPDPISSINPIVNTMKNKSATEKPKTLTWYNVTAKGYSNSTSKSKIKNNRATMKK